MTERSDAAQECCRICGSHDITVVCAREMMFGMRDRFRYLECASCGCVQIAEYPENISEYYPKNYYSFQPADEPENPGSLSIKNSLLRKSKQFLVNRTKFTRRCFLSSKSTAGWISRHQVAGYYAKFVPDANARILDVGCGSGALLKELYGLYYTDISGVDPFIAADIHHGGRRIVRKATLGDLAPAFDCISFHHVLEHMPDQPGVLRQAAALLATDGLIMARIPVISAAWRCYREDWVQLDAPRHYYLHSEHSFRLLADAAGLVVESIDYDSSGFQFWGSEMYRRDIPLMEASGPGKSLQSLFPADELAAFETRAAALNRERQGDQIVAILRRKPDAA